MKKIYYYCFILFIGLQLEIPNHATSQIFGDGANPRNYGYEGKNFKSSDPTKGQARINAITKYTPYFKAVLGIIAIIGMVGAFRIYIRWQNGEEVFTDIVRWSMAGLVIPIAYGIWSAFFLNT